MLLDHFHPPLSDLGWKDLRHQWAAVLAADLNSRLPTGWRAQTEIDFGIEVEVGVVEDEHSHVGSPAVIPWSPPAPDLYATAYRTVYNDADRQATQLLVWEESLNVGAHLPVLPLFLRVGPMLPVDLDATYHVACQQLRIPTSATVHH